MSLEPTEEQLVKLAGALVDEGADPGEAVTDAATLWPLIRDMVLEEAAKACEREATIDGQVIPGLRNELDCARALRALKAPTP